MTSTTNNDSEYTGNVAITEGRFEPFSAAMEALVAERILGDRRHGVSI
ncbi:hypothetical protein HQO39_04620 [Rhodococcus fascians]|nr:hypothetical protein [Rhodococcus fascians]